MILGAGLDTFAYRNPFPQLRVFEVDFPATQEWKRSLLASAAIAVPGQSHLCPTRLRAHDSGGGFERRGIRRHASPHSSAGSALCLTSRFQPSAPRSRRFPRLPAGTAVSFDYGISPHALNLVHRMTFRALARRVARAGEPFRLLFTPEQLDQEFVRAGFGRFEQLGAAELNELYFANRSEGIEAADAGFRPARYGVGLVSLYWNE